MASARFVEAGWAGDANMASVGLAFDPNMASARFVEAGWAGDEAGRH